MKGGAVAVREGGHVHSLETTSLEGDIEVDASADPGPMVRVPEGVGVEYRDGDEELEELLEEDGLATDGGTITTRTAVQGLGIEQDSGLFLGFVGTLAAAASGYLWASEMAITATVVLVAGAVTLFVGSGGYLRGA